MPPTMSYNHLNKAAIDLFFRNPNRPKAMPSSSSSSPSPSPSSAVTCTPLTRQRWLEEFLRVRRRQAVESQEPQKSHTTDRTPPPCKKASGSSGLFSLARWWRRHPKPRESNPLPTTTPSPSPSPSPSPVPALPPAPSHAPAPPSAHAHAHALALDADVDVDTDTDRTATDPHSLLATTSTDGQGSSSYSKKTPIGVSSLLDETERATPAGEKGRFIEHVPEANHVQWRSQLLAY